MIKKGIRIGVWFMVMNFIVGSIVTEPVWYWWIIEIFCLLIAIIMVDNEEDQWYNNIRKRGKDYDNYKNYYNNNE